MLVMSRYVWLLLLAICCWHCMALKEKDSEQVPVGSNEASSGSGEDASGSGEDASGSGEDASGSGEDASGSGEDASGSGEDGSGEDESGSGEYGSGEDGSSEDGSGEDGSSEDGSGEDGSSEDGSGEDSSSEYEAPTCKDQKKNQDETDIDCGGGKCAKCAEKKICLVDRDCISGVCNKKKCAKRITTAQIVSTTVPATTMRTTPEATTTTQPEATTTQPEATTTTQPEATTTTTPTCEPECKNNGTCTDNDVCTCTTGFSGPTCDVQSVGLCLNSETFSAEPILLISFGNGSAQYSTAKPADFHFSTTYQQRFEPVTNDGMFSFINSIHNDFNDAWHTNALDHSGNEGGYMYLVNADLTPGQFYNGRVDDLCVGLRYEFSVYLANICKPNGKINPNVLFEVRSVDGNMLLAQLNSGDVVEHNSLTWEKYGFSFIAPNSSVNLLMISNARGGEGNDLVIDDIALRVCAHEGTGFCPSN